MKKKLTVIIIAGNEEDNIADCLDSVKWADEVILVDSESTDKTVEIASRYDCKIFIRKWEGFAQQKAFSLSCASNKWVLSLDADERISQELQNEIKLLLSGKIEKDAYEIPRKSFFWDKWIKSCGWYPNYQKRLFKKDNTSLTERKVHESFVIEGSIGRLKSDIIHYTHTDIKKTIAKINDYSSLSAEEKFMHKDPNYFSIVFYPLVAFFSHYIFKRGFADGIHGLMVSILHAQTKLMMYMKIWEKRNVK